jgi:hypothetical protein
MYAESNQSFVLNGVPTLHELLRQLRVGMHIQGRIIRNFENGTFLLRIRNYNILSQSNQRCPVGSEKEFLVRQVQPHLILEVINKTPVWIKNDQNYIELMI